MITVSALTSSDTVATSADGVRHPCQLNMQLESIPALGLHSRELSVRSNTWPSESLGRNSATPDVGVDVAIAAGDASELAGAMAADASCEVRTCTWTIPATTKNTAMLMLCRIAVA